MSWQDVWTKRQEFPDVVPKYLTAVRARFPHRQINPAKIGEFEMTRDEYIFRNATQIAEQRIRVARKLQANEAERKWKRTLAASKKWVIQWMSSRQGTKSLSS